MLVAPPDGEQLVCQVERNHYRDAVEPDDFAAIADLPHASIEKFRSIEQRRALLIGAGNEVFLLEDPDADARLVLLQAQAPCSRVLSRPMIASTRVRTCSFFCTSDARSPESDS